MEIDYKALLAYALATLEALQESLNAESVPFAIVKRALTKIKAGLNSNG